MKTDILISDILPEVDVQNALNSATSCSNQFTDIVKALGLNREFDFQNSNLRDVDFSFSDLRGYNFSGADLTGSHGISVTFDKTTILHNADVQNSLFANFRHETLVWNNTPKADLYYMLLKNSENYEISDWLTARFMSGNDNHRLLKKIDDDVAAVLCQKLITDEIDLTKRTSLFYFLKKTSASGQTLRETILSVLARHLDKASVVRSFVRVAGKMYAADPIIGKSLVSLCQDARIDVRESAFRAIDQTELMQTQFRILEKQFFSDDNTELRQKLLLGSAIKLGNDHLLSINMYSKMRNLEISEVIDIIALLEDQTISEIVKSQSNRASSSSHQRIRELQEEVIIRTPVLSTFFVKRNFFDASKATKRIEKREEYLQKKANEKIERSLRMMRLRQR